MRAVDRSRAIITAAQAWPSLRVEAPRALGYALEDIVEAVQALEPADFIKSETAHSPGNSRVWHGTYHLFWDDRWLYLKFAGETLIDVTLTSIKDVGKEVGNV